MKNFVTRFKNARNVVKQIKNGEWSPITNPYVSGVYCHAERDGLDLWIGNGPWFCEIRNIKPYTFGLFWRHYVWWAAARSLYHGSKEKVIEL